MARAATATKIAQQFGRGEFTPAQREIVEDIFRLMIRDAEVRVRQALAENLKRNPGVPHDVAVILARDVEAVALPMLEFSEVLTSEDLVAIVCSQGEEKQKAVARRHTVDSRVSAALVDVGSEDVVATLARNQGSDISDTSFHKMMDRFGTSEKVQGSLVDRSRLPVTVAERLVTTVSEHLRDHFLARHDLPEDVTAALVLHSRERATIGLSSESSEDEVETLIRHLRVNNRLTPSIIIRAVCMGDIQFFEYALSELTDIPVVSARTLIHDSGDLGLQSLFAKAGLPSHYYQAARAAIDALRETHYDGERNDQTRFQRRMIERILTQYGDRGVNFENDDLEYLLTKMEQLSSPHPGEET
ncbi:MAG: hypothetical protein FD149_1802 [Rhodospirillaceae bacterium]|nr:MAG: hypothetical protein FD149_1802 [Rhodospirillaceae bacterium]